MNRLKSLRLENNKLQSDIGKILGVSDRAVGNYENGKRDMSPETIIKLANYFNVSTDYLLGKTDIRKPDNSKLKIPVLGVVKAGYDYLAEENIIGYVTVNDNSLKNDDFFALKVKGNSMIPEIYENDIAIVKKQADFENGDYVVALINGEEATIKTGYKTDTGLLLRPANNAFSKLEFDKNDIEKLPVKIIGVVYNITRSFK